MCVCVCVSVRERERERERERKLNESDKIYVEKEKWTKDYHLKIFHITRKSAPIMTVGLQEKRFY